VDAAAVEHRSLSQIAATFRKEAQALRDKLQIVAQGIANAEASGAIAQRLTSASLARSIAKCTRNFYDLHLQLSFIQGPWIAPEMETFVRAVCEDVAASIHAPRAVSIVTSDNYIFEEVNLSAYFSSLTGTKNAGATPTLFIPKIDAGNPLLWPTLIHEYAHTHHVYIEGTPLYLFVKGLNVSQEARDILMRWTEELYCDLFAQHLLGPAYLAALTDFVIFTAPIEYIEAETETHPLPRFRVTALFGDLGLADERVPFERALIAAEGHSNTLASISSLLFDERCEWELRDGAPLPSKRQRTRRMPVEVDLNHFRNEVLRTIDEFVPEPLRRDRFGAATLTSLTNRLTDRIPIGSIPIVWERERARKQMRAASDAIDAELLTASPAEDKIEAELHRMQDAIAERPTTISEILNAGWSYKWQFIYDPLIADIENLTADGDADLQNRLFLLDDILRNSIETAYFGRLFVKFRPGERPIA